MMELQCHEVHLINKEVNLEKKQLIIKPVEKIRAQGKFASLKDLSDQIKLDAKKAKSILTYL